MRQGIDRAESLKLFIKLQPKEPLMRILSLRSVLLICLLSSVIGCNYFRLITWAPGVAAGQDDCSGGINVPNRYNVPFCVRDDELFIFAVNYKPFEYTPTEQRT